MPPATPPTPTVAPPAPATPPPPPAARVTGPTEHAAFRASTPAVHPPDTSIPKATSQERMKSVFALEEILGRNWLNKIGIVLIVLGVAYFGIKELGQLGPFGKVALSYVISLALLGGGIFLEKRERYRVFSYPAIGGGWSLLFWTTYALNHVAAMQVLDSVSTDLILMLAVALAMVVHTLRYRSQVVTGIAFLLAYGTVALSNDDVYSLSSGVILAIGLVAIVIKMGWFELEVFGILSSYGNHLYWLYRLLGPTVPRDTRFPTTTPALRSSCSTGSPIAFRTSSAKRSLRSKSTFPLRLRCSIRCCCWGTMKFQSVQPEARVLGAADHWSHRVQPGTAFDHQTPPRGIHRSQCSGHGADDQRGAVPLLRQQRRDPLADRRRSISRRRRDGRRSRVPPAGTIRRLAGRLASGRNRFSATHGRPARRRQRCARRRSHVRTLRRRLLPEHSARGAALAAVLHRSAGRAHAYRSFLCGMLRGCVRRLGIVLCRLDCSRFRRRDVDPGRTRPEADDRSTCKCSTASSAC